MELNKLAKYREEALIKDINDYLVYLDYSIQFCKYKILCFSDFGDVAKDDLPFYDSMSRSIFNLIKHHGSLLNKDNDKYKASDYFNDKMKKMLLEIITFCSKLNDNEIKYLSTEGLETRDYDELDKYREYFYKVKDLLPEGNLRNTLDKFSDRLFEIQELITINFGDNRKQNINMVYNIDLSDFSDLIWCYNPYYCPHPDFLKYFISFLLKKVENGELSDSKFHECVKQIVLQVLEGMKRRRVNYTFTNSFKKALRILIEFEDFIGDDVNYCFNYYSKTDSEFYDFLEKNTGIQRLIAIVFDNYGNYSEQERYSFLLEMLNDEDFFWGGNIDKTVDFLNELPSSMSIREAINIIEDLMSKRFDYEGDYSGYRKIRGKTYTLIYA